MTSSLRPWWIVCPLAAAVTAVSLAAHPAWAHVTIHPASAAKGSFAILSFSVPNEKSNATTMQFEVQFPRTHPIPHVSIQPIPGWSHEVTRRTLAKPIESEDGAVRDVVDTVTWSGGSIEPGEFQLFTVSVGPLPTNTKKLVFKSLQTYSDGDIVRWIETPARGAPEPEHPAPVLRLTKVTSKA